MKKSMTWLALALLAAAAIGCGAEVKDEKYSYEFELNGCNTGKHSAESREQYCRNLQDEKLNKGCAVSLRDEALERECSAAGT